MQAFIADEKARQQNLRIIGVDRPGYGLSEMAPHMTLLDWTKDVAALADQLKIGRFSVIGISAGGPYALACARAMPDRLCSVSVLSGMGIVTEQELKHMAPMRRWVMSAVLRAPWAVRAATWPVAFWARRRPEQFLQWLGSRMAEPDQRVLARPDIRTLFPVNIVESFSQGGRGTAYDLVLFTRSWDFEPREVTTEVYIWHGKKDVTVPVSLAQAIARDMPNAHLTLYPDEGHLAVVTHLDEILDTLASTCQEHRTN